MSATTGDVVVPIGRRAPTPAPSCLTGPAAEFFGKELAQRFEPGFLLADDRKRLPLALAAVEIAAKLKGLVVVVREPDQLDKFYFWIASHWLVSFDTRSFREVVTIMAVPGCRGGLGRTGEYTEAFCKELVSLLLAAPATYFPVPRFAVDWIGFQNGVMLSTDGDEIDEAVGADFGPIRCLPYEYDQNAACPSFHKWVEQLVGYDSATVNLIRAFLRALLTGTNPQKILFMLGKAGSGKSTFLNLVERIVGPENCASVDLQQLENGRFEIARVVGKSLVVCNEVSRVRSVAKLKSISGGDLFGYELKGVQATGNTRFHGVVCLAGNYPLGVLDEGLSRRLVTVRCDLEVSAQMRAAWRELGGVEKVLYAEIPGIINWALDMEERAMWAAFDLLPERVTMANLEGELGDSMLADWLFATVVQDPNGSVPVSDLFDFYKSYADATRTLQKSQTQFGRELHQIVNRLRVPIEKRRTGGAWCWHGLRLATEQDACSADNWILRDGR